MERKRPVVIFSSSSDEEREEVRGGGRRMKSHGGERRRGGGQKRARGVAKAPAAGSSSRRSDEARQVSFDDLSEDFSECLHGLDVVPSGSRRKGMQELWVDKYKPCSMADLAVHRKKVEQIKKWLEERMAMSKDLIGNNVLLITGQSGSGKSAVVNVLASELGAELCEWRTPTPTLWKEHLHNSYSGISYMSKLDEFELFVEQVRKYQLLSSTFEGPGRKPVIFLIDDLPVTNARVALGRLRKSLDVVVRSAPVPTLILITEFPKDDASDNVQHHGEGLEMFLERAGASKVSFNPITINSIKKTLVRICRAEKCVVSEEWITLIAKASGGDIRHAITSLQYFCLGPTQLFSRPHSSVPSHLNDIGTSPSAILADNESIHKFSLPFGRDETLSLFHALGKFLHNKRDAERGRECCPFLLKEQYARHPSKLEDPEKALGQAHGQARSITDFLHENVLDFISDEAIQDAWTVASYLSDADCLLFMARRPTTQQMRPWKYEPEHISQLIAASVAVRGVLFGNSHPSSSRWHSMRTPSLWRVDQSSRVNRSDLVMERFQTFCSVSSTSISVIATEYRPTIRWLGSGTLVDALDGESLLGNMREGDHLDVSEMSVLEGTCRSEESEDIDDEIEEW